MIQFTKYQGTGNDFIMIDATRTTDFQLSSMQINQLCNRRFGIGADGVILIYLDNEVDFKMDYFNKDGSQSFCGNGARCAVHFSNAIGTAGSFTKFKAIDGIHSATIENERIALKMNDVSTIEKEGDAYLIDTGSPHFICFVDDLSKMDIVEYGKQIRYSKPYAKNGINVNLVQEVAHNHLKMLTYERGVEDETYSCGTGATAVAMAYADKTNQNTIDVLIDVKGGELRVETIRSNSSFNSTFLIGPAVPVFNGKIEL